MAPKTFAEALKQARLAAGLSQAALARRAGLTGSYISVLESRRRPPPSPRVVRSLCRVLEVDPRPLLEAAALERSPPTVRRRIERMRRQQGQVQRTRDRLLTTTLFHIAHRPRVVEPLAEFLDLPPGQQALLGRLLGRVRRSRSVDEAESKTEEILEETTPADRDALVRVLPGVIVPESGEGDRGVVAPVPVEPVDEARRAPVLVSLEEGTEPAGERAVDEEAWNPDVFFWRVAGDEAHPRFEAGDLLLLDPRRTPEDGDVVVVRHEGRDVAGVFHLRGEEVHVAFPRPELPPLRLSPEAFHPAGVVIRLVRDL